MQSNGIQGRFPARAHPELLFVSLNDDYTQNHKRVGGHESSHPEDYFHNISGKREVWNVCMEPIAIASNCRNGTNDELVYGSTSFNHLLCFITYDTSLCGALARLQTKGNSLVLYFLKKVLKS
jgi:hypothetical protein